MATGSQQVVVIACLLMAAPAVASDGPFTSTPGSASDDSVSAPVPSQPRYTARSYGSRPESEPPGYVRTLDTVGVDAFAGIRWLEVGLDYRTRLELHDNDFNREVEQRDASLLIRTRAYLGLRDLLDPLRFTVEFEDARRYVSQFDLDNRDVNTFEPIQLYGELHFGRRFGMAQRPVSLRVGRMAFEQVDRRLIGRNGWRNTTNTFQGARAILGQSQGSYQVDTFALQPLQRLLTEFDEPRTGQWFFGAIATLRQWSEVVTLQPYYLRLRQSPTDTLAARDIHSPALRAFGLVGDTAIDFDLQGVVQFGDHQGQNHRAWGMTAELGYTLEVPWKYRIHASYGHATGDRDPNDDRNQRFERMFGFARPFSNNLYFLWENFRTPKVRVDMQPDPRLRINFGYGAFWLDSVRDRWNSPNLRDPSGESGRFLGHEFDVYLQGKLLPRLDLNLGYAFFAAGAFPASLGREQDSHFGYVELVARAF
jgi:hypothetical protein